MPQSRITSIWWASRGRFRIGRIGFGLRSENGYIRAPLPAARMTPTIWLSRLSAMGFAGRFARTLQRISSRITRTASNARIFLPSSNVRPEKLTGTSVNRAPRCASRAVNSASKSNPFASMRRPLIERRPVHLVAGHQVGNVHAIQHAGGARHRQVADPVEEPHAFDRALETAAVDDVGAIGR